MQVCLLLRVCTIYIEREKEREREICFIFIESIYSLIVFTASKAGIPDPKGCYIRHWKSNNQPPLPIQASPGYLESSQSVFLWLLSLTSLQSCRCRQYDSFQGCLVSFFLHQSKKLLKKLKCKSFTVSLGAYGALTPKYAAGLYCAYQSEGCFVQSITVHLKCVLVAQLPSFVDCIWGANRWKCSLVGQAPKTTHITEAAPAETRQEVFVHQDHEGLHMHVHRTSKMCRGPRFLFPKHMMLNSRLHTPAVSIIWKELEAGGPDLKATQEYPGNLGLMVPGIAKTFSIHLYMLEFDFFFLAGFPHWLDRGPKLHPWIRAPRLVSWCETICESIHVPRSLWPMTGWNFLTVGRNLMILAWLTLSTADFWSDIGHGGRKMHMGFFHTLWMNWVNIYWTFQLAHLDRLVWSAQPHLQFKHHTSHNSCF